VSLPRAATFAPADPACIVSGPGYRISVLTSRLVRFEWNDDGAFVDGPTQLVHRRRFPVPDVTVHREADGGLDLWTDDLHVRYDEGPLVPGGLTVSLRNPVVSTHHTTWRYGDTGAAGPPEGGNLGGTARTLDDVDGRCALEPGLLARHGHAVVDDSTSLLLGDDGWPRPRPVPGRDLYFFGYGSDHLAALRDYLTLTGPSPLLPRYALGNWWSRFHRYTTDAYLELMDRFAEEGLPFSVAVLDMDWHLVDIDPALGNGWTGYTWDRDLFPDPGALLRELHDRHLRVALNVHPADGVRRHEDAYPDVAHATGLDPASGLPVAFDVTSRTFADAYLTHLHHPHEELGVDFWWIDWQSGDTSRTPGLDPLWMLNDLHYRDAVRDGDRPLVLSRYAGLGSHRFPVGFSGDTVATWASLAFQPEFTATAANVGYFWWSHDIGGHGGGARDEELATRWYQFGVFSPINRLHSSNSPFNAKEPWRFSPPTCEVMSGYLRLRHQLVPYLYTAMWAAHTDGIGPIRPMYHDHPETPEAYEVPNQFSFGPDLLVAPITGPADRATHLARVDAWLPEGRWFDVFTGLAYDGGRRTALHRPIEELPVLARAGAIVPLAADPMAPVEPDPEELELWVFPDASGGAVVHEDDGRASTTVSERRETRFRLTWEEPSTDTPANATLSVDPPTGPDVRTTRRLAYLLFDVVQVGTVRATAGGTEVAVDVGPDEAGRGLVLDLGEVALDGGITVRLDGVVRRGDDRAARVFALLDRAEINHAAKQEALDLLDALSGAALIAGLHRLGLPETLFGALLEILAARSR
jgi:hypothetical protein